MIENREGMVIKPGSWKDSPLQPPRACRLRGYDFRKMFWLDVVTRPRPDNFIWRWLIKYNISGIVTGVVDKNLQCVMLCC